jgi:hypothetical protein
VTSSPGGIIVSTDSATFSASFSNLTNGTPYTFSAVATNTSGNSASSAASAAVTPVAEPAAGATPVTPTPVVPSAEPAAGATPVTPTPVVPSAEPAAGATPVTPTPVVPSAEPAAGATPVTSTPVATPAKAAPVTLTPVGSALFASGALADWVDRSSPWAPSASASSNTGSSNWLLWALKAGGTQTPDSATGPAAGAPEGNWFWAVVDGGAPIRMAAADAPALESVQEFAGKWAPVEPGLKPVGTADTSPLVGPPDGGRYWAASARQQPAAVFDCIPGANAVIVS